MTHVIKSCLLLLTSVLALKAAERGMSAVSPMERAFVDVKANHLAHTPFRLHRTIRSTGGVPCVSIPVLTELKGRFVNWLDHNNDGVSTFDEVKNYLRKFKPNVSDDVVSAFIRRRDTDGNGAIDFVPEYVHDLSAPDYTLEGATEWFRLQDSNDDGYVDEQELVTVARAVGMSPEEASETVQSYYMSADKDGDGRLAFDEFKTLYQQ